MTEVTALSTDEVDEEVEEEEEEEGEEQEQENEEEKIADSATSDREPAG
jgi:hypothetical protein